MVRHPHGKHLKLYQLQGHRRCVGRAVACVKQLAKIIERKLNLVVAPPKIVRSQRLEYRQNLHGKRYSLRQLQSHRSGFAQAVVGAGACNRLKLWRENYIPS